MNFQFFKPSGLLLFVGFALMPTAEISGHEGSHEFSLPIEQIEQVETFEALRLYGRLSAYHPEAEEHFRDALLQRDDLEAFFQKRLEELPQTAFNGKQRNLYFKLLGSLRTPWAARLCGQHLLSKETIELPEFQTEEEARRFFLEEGGSATPNSGYAMLALEKMNIDTAPCIFGMPTPPGEKTRKDLWREWWRSNQANIEDLLARVDTPSSSRKDDPMSVAGDSTDIQQSDSGTPEVQSARHHRHKHGDTKVDSSRWRLILGITLCFVALAGWLIFRTRRAKRP